MPEGGRRFAMLAFAWPGQRSTIKTGLPKRIWQLHEACE
jgi:hypothetical protein